MIGSKADIPDQTLTHMKYLLGLRGRRKQEYAVDFLDITLGLITAIYKPYRKPFSNLTYIHKQNNHSPSIIKALPKGINKSLPINSENAQIFNEACPSYTDALKKDEYNRLI